MADMLVRLYNLPELAPAVTSLTAQGISIRAAFPSEKYTVADWVQKRFAPSWAVGCEVAAEMSPSTLFLAVQRDVGFTPTENPYQVDSEKLLGFACYDVAARGMFGALGVDEAYRERGIGTALTLTCLHAMREQRYAYAIIGWAGDPQWYARICGATLIADSEPGIFTKSLQTEA